LVAHKGHRHLLEAWRDIATRVPASLLIAGSGELDAELRAQAADIPHVHFLGWRDDLAALWASVDLTVQASLEEGLGTALIDAQLAGLPVVATTAGGIPEVVADGVSGLLVPPADPDALAAALLRVLTDAALRARLAVGARSHARNFLASAMVAGYQRLYAELGIAGPHAGGDASKPEAS
jgi:glycosyltransferase involved in cell wall biosynthesis